MSKLTKAQVAEREEAIIDLKKRLPPGTNVYTKTEHVSRSGMMRCISAYVIEDNEPNDISYLVARVIHEKINNKHGGITVGGCGMDMGFHVVYSLSSHLYRDGFECIGDSEGWGKKCPSNDHLNGDRNYEPHHHQSGGYALRQRWM